MVMSACRSGSCTIGLPATEAMTKGERLFKDEPSEGVLEHE